MKLPLGISLEKFCDLVGLVCGQVIQNDVNLLVRLTAGDHLFEESDEFRTGVPLGSLALHLPRLTSSAAYKDNVPLRRYSKPCRSSRPGDNGSTGSRRSSAWMAVFSSMQNTAACCGGVKLSCVSQCSGPRQRDVVGSC